MQIVTTAALWRRFAALVYDSLILLAISMAYGAIVTAIGSVFTASPTNEFNPMFEPGSTRELVFLGWLLSLIIFYVYFWQRSGQTVGMRAWRLKLVDQNTPNKLPSTMQCLQRSAWGVFSFWMLGLGYWYRFFNRDGQCLHDKLSQCQVVVLPKVIKPKR